MGAITRLTPRVKRYRSAVMVLFLAHRRIINTRCQFVLARSGLHSPRLEAHRLPIRQRPDVLGLDEEPGFRSLGTSLVFDRYPFERKNFIRIILIASGRVVGSGRSATKASSALSGTGWMRTPIIPALPGGGTSGPLPFFRLHLLFSHGITISKMITQISCSCEGQGDTQCQFANALGKRLAPRERLGSSITSINTASGTSRPSGRSREAGRLSCQRSDRRQPWHAYAMTSRSITVAEAAQLWLTSCENHNLER